MNDEPGFFASVLRDLATSTAVKVIRGSLMDSAVAGRDIPQYLQYFLEGRMPVDRLKSGTMGFKGLNLSLDALDKGAVLRQILLPHR